MPTLYETLLDFFTVDDWPFTPIEGQTAVRTGYRTDAASWNCYAQVKEDKAQIFFYSICPMAAPEDKRGAVAEFITRANYGMPIGNFEMDYGDGEIRFKTSVDVEGVEINTTLLYNLVYANIWAMDQYLPGILAVLYGNLTPVESIEQVESAASPAGTGTAGDDNSPSSGDGIPDWDELSKNI